MTSPLTHASHIDNISFQPYSLDLLPDSLADLLSLAVDDARSLDSTVYLPDAQRWHTPTDAGPCHVCLAGSVLACAFRDTPDLDLMPAMFSLHTYRKLHAIDHMRCGNWLDAYESLHDRSVPDETAMLLVYLPQPDSGNFHNWHHFNDHLASLEAIVPRLREIEEADQRR